MPPLPSVIRELGLSFGRRKVTVAWGLTFGLVFGSSHPPYRYTVIIVRVVCASITSPLAKAFSSQQLPKFHRDVVSTAAGDLRRLLAGAGTVGRFWEPYRQIQARVARHSTASAAPHDCSQLRYYPKGQQRTTVLFAVAPAPAHEPTSNAKWWRQGALDSCCMKTIRCSHYNAGFVPTDTLRQHYCRMYNLVLMIV